MMVFGGYANYYDLLYRDKDYAAEYEFVEGLLRRHDGEAHSILDIGCGTGRHAELFARHGHEVVGIDRSSQMLSNADARRESLSHAMRQSLRFMEGDARDLDLGRHFDAVIALFHMMSYMTTDRDLSAAIDSARRHLKPGHLFLFDFWYGPAVIASPPTARVKQVQDEAVVITRTATPVHHPEQHRVEVRYDICAADRKTSRTTSMQETHHVRYFFLPEVAEALTANGFDVVSAHQWLTGRPPSAESWNACMLARAVAR